MDQELIKKIVEQKLDDKLLDEINKMELDEEKKQLLLAVLKILALLKNEIPKEVMDKLSAIVGYQPPEYAAPYYYYQETKKDALEDNLPKEVKEKVEKLFKEKQELEEELKKIKIEKERKDFETTYVFKNIPSEINEALFEIRNAQGFQSIIKVLKALDEQISQNNVITKEVGVNGSSDNVSVWDKIQKSAEKIAEEEKISLSQAISKVLKINPNLYNEYLSERR